jgi:hypothetical protein
VPVRKANIVPSIFFGHNYAYNAIMGNSVSYVWIASKNVSVSIIYTKSFIPIL